MIKDYEAKHIFMAIALVILVISPVLLLLTPAFVANTLYNTAEDWHIFVPGVSYIFYGLGFLFLVLSPAIIFILNIGKKSLIFGLVFLLLSSLSFYIGSGPIHP